MGSIFSNRKTSFKIRNASLWDCSYSLESDVVDRLVQT